MVHNIHVLVLVTTENGSEKRLVRATGYLGGGGSGEHMTSIIFSTLEQFSFGYWAEEGKMNKWAESREQGCMCIKNWFKPIFP
jgi:hypothetical protein